MRHRFRRQCGRPAGQPATKRQRSRTIIVIIIIIVVIITIITIIIIYYYYVLSLLLASRHRAEGQEQAVLRVPAGRAGGG